MKLHNRCGNGLSHTLQVKKGDKVKNVTYFIANDDFGEVLEKVAKIWLNIPGVTEYVEPEDLKKAEAEAQEKLEALEKAEAEAKEKQAALEKENAELKKKLEALEKAEAEKKSK